MNTYGLRSVNTDTFNLKWHTNYTYPQEARNVVVTLLKVHNLTLNILGYIPGISVVSGSLRIGTGLLMCVVTLAVGERDAEQGVIIGHWYDEALFTGVSQIGRGIFEAFVPFGRTVNAILDSIGTVWNLGKELGNASVCPGCMQYANHRPYPDPKYPLPFSLLHLV